MDTKRLILFVIFSFSIMMLWEAWQRDHAPQIQQADTQAVQSGDVGVPQPVSAQPVAVHEVGFSMQQGERIHVRTDLYQAEIDTTGGDIRQLELLKHRDSKDIGKYFTLFDDHALPAVYVAQSGLIGNGLPSHKVVFSTKGDNFSMQDGHDALEVRLNWDNGKGVQVDKIYTFHRGSYVTDLTYEIHNGGNTPLDPSVYYQIVHDSASDQGTKMMPTFTGAAYFTDAEKFKKISFSAMEKNNLSLNSSDGWIGLVQHYFVSAWIPKAGTAREYYTRHLSDNVYSMGAVSTLGSVAPGATISITARLYAGPQEQSQLLAAAPGMKYTVDYGWLTIIATPLFWILSNIEKLVQNWGVAIILLTVLLKLAFYPLSAASYRSMAHMRELAPRLQKLKEKFGDDRQKLHQAMMELYKTEKINPMGGCLPIVVQIPVFISLYWVLLGNVEMRHAPFVLWIHDLSASDPYYVLPIIMGITMIIQSRLNPTPPDPIQAKVMMFMPVVFSVFFFFFPAGLVLYWVVNNILSITQQWYINRTIGLAAKSKKGHAHS
ncbi:membrane protein insertase YidC [mine drainage metagenome]|uniref:Membrane protein insertase YidC n=1 Tax=mine drainage metagenome TaxID=410659 RepID=A0A1J5RR83_9ZZZZ